MDITKLITEQLNDPNLLKTLGKAVGADASQVREVTGLGLPALLEALGRNAGSPDKASALAKALDQHQDDDVDDLDSFLGKVDTADGAKMLQHIFGGSNAKVQQNLAGKTGLDTSQVSGILAQLAPLLLGSLGQQKKKQNMDITDIAGLLGGLSKQSAGGGMMGMVSELLDSDNDGSIMDDVGNLLGRFMKK